MGGASWTSPGMTTLCSIANVAKLLRGHALSDMSNSGGKVAENCRKSRLEPLQIVNFREIGPKFLAAQRHTF
ncbi:hypothetical protein CO669_02470 [Bradyrhizobium sp. Y36]|nr:hypothetical protein CO669_02470 [Bradyrhizobium sp. Y36]